MPLSVLNVAFPFARVDADPVGGAEQVVALLDRALVAAGHRSIIVAPAGSRSAGELVAIARPSETTIDAHARTRIVGAVRCAIGEVLARERIDVLHFHGSDFDTYLPPHGPPALITLHLPFAWYGAQALRPQRPRTFLLPVSASQARAAPAGVPLLPPIENGVDCAAFPVVRKRRFALMLGRVCREKGFHDALDACREARLPLLLAGEVFAWPEHRRYFSEEILPRLDHTRRWIGAIGGARKRRLLAAAHCVLAPSRAPETSSLVAMEALAAGTAVIAYRSGALREIVDHGRTGFLVDDSAAMAAAIPLATGIDPHTCRGEARTRFDAARTTRQYLELYAMLARLGC